MGSSLTRATFIWFAAAMVVGAAATLLHLFRSAIGDGSTATLLAVIAYVLTALTAVLVYRGIMVAAAEQDASRVKE